LTPYLVDSNVIIDVITGGSGFLDWSASALVESAQSGVLFINPIVFAEVSTGFSRREDVTAAIDALDFEYADLPWDAAFIAGKAFVRYRREGGTRRSPLPDFYIGAHALVSGMTLLTRDATRYRTYFPKLKILAP
jgi:predicted nucleic acid-binding protein